MRCAWFGHVLFGGLSLGLFALAGWLTPQLQAQPLPVPITTPPVEPTGMTPRWPTPKSLPQAETISLKPAEKAGKAYADVPTEQRNLLRVGLTDNMLDEFSYPSTKVGATGDFWVVNADTEAILMEGQASDRLYVSAGGEGLVLQLMNNGQVSQTIGLQTEPVMLQPKQASDQVKVYSITRRGQYPRYRGWLKIQLDEQNKNLLQVINLVDLDDYLRAVVPNELPIRFGAEAVRAQAVAARNYAIAPREKPWTSFDICDSQYCQAYYGAQTETPQTDKLLEETEGLVALYEGKPLLALFSSGHGGYSEAYQWVFSDPVTGQFPAPPLPYLQANPDNAWYKKRFPLLMKENQAWQFWQHQQIESYDDASSLHRWSYRWSRSKLESILAKELVSLSENPITAPYIKPHFREGQALGRLKRLHVKQRGFSGKLVTLQIETTQGRWTLKKEYLIRKALRVPTNTKRFLPSGNAVFSHLTDKNGNLVAIRVDGGGFGHGVGMSQYGASGMAKKGASFPGILRHYYPGSALGSLPLTAHPTLAKATYFRAPYLHAASTETFKKPAVEPTLHTYWPCKTTERKPLLIELNNAIYTLPVTKAAHTVAPIANRISRTARNSLKLLPLPQANTLTLGCRPSIWVEVVPPASTG